jgi:thioredoxin-like negative regulator of GroEL
MAGFTHRRGGETNLPESQIVLEENGSAVLIFFSSVRSGPARRMDSLVANIARKERRYLRVLQVDIDERPDLAFRFRVRLVPTLVLVKQERIVERIEGRVSATMLVHMLEAHLVEEMSRAASQ